MLGVRSSACAEIESHARGSEIARAHACLSQVRESVAELRSGAWRRCATSPPKRSQLLDVAARQSVGTWARSQGLTHSGCIDQPCAPSTRSCCPVSLRPMESRCLLDGMAKRDYPPDPRVPDEGASRFPAADWCLWFVARGRASRTVHRPMAWDDAPSRSRTRCPLPLRRHGGTADQDAVQLLKESQVSPRGRSLLPWGLLQVPAPCSSSCSPNAAREPRERHRERQRCRRRSRGRRRDAISRSHRSLENVVAQKGPGVVVETLLHLAARLVAASHEFLELDGNL